MEITDIFPHLVVIGKCAFCKGDIYDYPRLQPYYLYYPINRLKQILEKGLVHKMCFDRAFATFNKDLACEGQLKNYKLWKTYKEDIKCNKPIQKNKILKL